MTQHILKLAAALCTGLTILGQTASAQGLTIQATNLEERMRVTPGLQSEPIPRYGLEIINGNYYRTAGPMEFFCGAYDQSDQRLSSVSILNELAGRTQYQTNSNTNRAVIDHGDIPIATDDALGRLVFARQCAIAGSQARDVSMPIVSWVSLQCEGKGQGVDEIQEFKWIHDIKLDCGSLPWSTIKLLYWRVDCGPLSAFPDRDQPRKVVPALGGNIDLPPSQSCYNDLGERVANLKAKPFMVEHDCGNYQMPRRVIYGPNASNPDAMQSKFILVHLETDFRGFQTEGISSPTDAANPVMCTYL